MNMKYMINTIVVVVVVISIRNTTRIMTVPVAFQFAGKN